MRNSNLRRCALWIAMRIPYEPLAAWALKHALGAASYYPAMNPWQVLQELYASEINAGMQSDWDGGIFVWIGGPISAGPILSQKLFLVGEFDQIGSWLDAEARRLFPASAYAKT